MTLSERGKSGHIAQVKKAESIEVHSALQSLWLTTTLPDLLLEETVHLCFSHAASIKTSLHRTDLEEQLGAKTIFPKFHLKQKV